MAKSVRLADIAAKLGISTVTVSKGLRGKDGVSEKLREEIFRTAEEMGYSLKAASESSGSDSLTIGIVTAERYLKRGSSFYWSLYERLLTHLSAQGDYALLEVIPDEDERLLRVPRLVQEKKADGMIIMGNFEETYLKTMLELPIPTNLLDVFHAWIPCDTVISDGYYGMYTMTCYLIEQGHRRLKYVGTVGETSSITDRYFGFSRALLEAGLPVSMDNVIPDRDADGKVDTKLPDDIAQTTDVLVCNCDFTAYDVLTKLTAMGLQVPQDISLVGFDNYILSEMSNVKITTYEVDQDAMAAASAAQIRARIMDGSANRKLQVISGRLLLRDSVLPLK